VSLENIFADFKTELAKVDPTLRFTGPAETDHESAPNRMNWAPVRATHAAPRGLGDATGGGPLLTRRWDILVEIWGESITATEELANLFLNVAQRSLTQFGYAPGQEQWEPGGVTAKGALCKMLFPLLTPVPRRQLATRPITAINATPTIGATP
jgi:hypothetical protein